MATIFGFPRRASIENQLTPPPSEAADPSISCPEPRRNFNELPHARINGRCFVSDDLLSRKGGRPRISWIKDHGIFVREVLSSDSGNRLGDAFWICRLCDQRSLFSVFKADATSSAGKHLTNNHRIYPSGDTSSSEDIAQASDTPPPSKRQRTGPSMIPKSETRKAQELALGFIVHANQPFTTFQDPYLRRLFAHFDPDLTGQMAWARTSLSQELRAQYKAKKIQVCQQLLQATSKIHLSFDLWTSPNTYAIMAAHAHFLDAGYKQKNILLALRRQAGSHEGENLASTLLQVIDDFQIRTALGTVVADNASNNDTCLAHLFPKINPTFSRFDVKDRRIRCYGHILNLVGRAFLYGEDAESFEQESDVLDIRGYDDLAHWRQRGPIGKLRNTVKFIRSSPQRSERFQAISKESCEDDGFVLFHQTSHELRLTLSNDTRWNSTYLMIERALRLKDHLTTFTIESQVPEESSKRIPDEDILSPEDWRLLAELKEAFEPLYQQTMRCQGWGRGDGHGRLWEVLAGLEWLLDTLESWKSLFDEPTGAQIQLTCQQSHIQPTTRPRRSHQPTVWSAEPQYLQDPAAICYLPEHVQAEYTTLNPAHRVLSLRDDSRAYFRISVTNAWQKLNEYYTKLEESPMYAAAVILHPGFGLEWLEGRWDTGDQLEWLRDAKKGLRRYWQRWYRDTAAPRSSEHPGNPNGVVSTLGTIATAGEASQFDQWIKNQKAARKLDEADEIDRYLGLHLASQEIDDPIAWWVSQTASFPTLSKMALDILSIPAMAADCERTFSLSKLTLSTQRLSMAPETLEQNQCLKSWLRQDLITLGGPGFHAEHLAFGEKVT